jgi:hypothetical protein
MRRALLLLPLLAFCIFTRTSPVVQLRANTKKAAKDEPLTLKVGDMAPDFGLLAFDGKEVKKVSLSSYRGKQNVALAFYVFAFTPG